MSQVSIAKLRVVYAKFRGGAFFSKSGLGDHSSLPHLKVGARVQVISPPHSSIKLRVESKDEEGLRAAGASFVALEYCGALGIWFMKALIFTLQITSHILLVMASMVTSMMESAMRSLQGSVYLIAYHRSLFPPATFAQ